MLLEIAQRIEAGQHDEQAALLSEAWDWLAEHSEPFRRYVLGTTQPGKFGSMVDAGAFESAAMVLVPPHCDLLMNTRCNFAHVWEKEDVGDGDWKSLTANWPALAIAAAAVRAWADA